MRGRLGFLVLALPLTMLGAIACSSFTAVSPSSGTDAGAGADSASATVDAAGPDAGVDDGGPVTTGPIDVLAGSDFEADQCSGWVGSNATLTTVDDAHGGAHACQVCRVDAATPFGLTQVVQRSPQIGKTLEGKGYFRAAPGTDATVTLQVATFLEGQQRQAGEATIQLGSDSWDPADAPLTPSADYDAVGLVALAVPAVITAPTACFIVDDLELLAPPVLAH